GHGIRAIAGPDLVVLRSPVPLQAKNFTHVAQFELAEGDRLAFTLSHGASHLAAPKAFNVERALAATEHGWLQWCERCTVQGEWAPFVRRSVMTLKALTYAPTGGLV